MKTQDIDQEINEKCFQEETETTIIQRVEVDGKVVNALKYKKDFSIGVCRLYNENGKRKESFEWENPGQVRMLSYDDKEQVRSVHVWNGDGKTIIQPDIKSQTAYVANCAENATMTVGRFVFTLDKKGHVIGTYYMGLYITVKE